MHTLLVTPSSDSPTLAMLDRALRARPDFEKLTLTGYEKAESQTLSTQPGLIILILTCDNAEEVLHLISSLERVHHGKIFVAGPATDPKLIIRIMQRGVDAFIDQTEIEKELDSSLSRLRGPFADKPRVSELLAVVSVAGGCGASTMAVNLAAILAKSTGHCNLIDLNPGKADLGPLLDLQPQYTLADLCRNEERLDRTLYEKLLTRHSSGVDLLAAPREFADVYALTLQGVQRAMGLARETYENIVVDLPNCYHDESLTVLKQATKICIVCRLDFTTIRNCRRTIDFLVNEGISRDRIQILVNQCGLPNQLPASEAERAIGCKLTWFIPHDPETVFWANNTGIPASIKDPDSAVVQSIANVIGLAAKKPPKKPWSLRVREIISEHIKPRVRSLVNRVFPSPQKIEKNSESEETVVCDGQPYEIQFAQAQRSCGTQYTC